MASVTTGYISEVKIDNGAVQNIGSSAYGECSTAAATAAKTVDMTGFTTLIKGATIHVKFTNSNTVANPTLNVNNTGAKHIKRYGTTAPSTAASNSWNGGSVISFTYDGTYWQMNDWMNTDANTTLSGIAYSDTVAGTAAKVAKMPGFALSTGQRIILYLATTSSVANATLNVNSTGAKPVKISSTATTASNFTAGYYICNYDGTNWNVSKVYWTDTTYTAGTDLALTNGAFKVNTSGTASGTYAFVEGGKTLATGNCSHAEGFCEEVAASIKAIDTSGKNFTIDSDYTKYNNTYILYNDSYYNISSITYENNICTIGLETSIGTTTTGTSYNVKFLYQASGGASHAEGHNTIASGTDSHAEGCGSIASGYYSHAEGLNTIANGVDSHAEGLHTIANYTAQHVFGKYNADVENAVEIVGNGASESARSNARILTWTGNETLAGNITLGNFTTLVNKASSAITLNLPSESGTLALTKSNVASATKATQDGDGKVITSTYLPLSGGTMSGNISFASSQTFPTLNQDTTGTAGKTQLLAVHNISTTVTTDKSTWNIPSGCTQVYGQLWKDTSLSTDTGNWVMWLAKSGTITTFNMRIDGTYYGSFNGNVTGNCSGSSGSCTGNSATATAASNVRGVTDTDTDSWYAPLFINTGYDAAVSTTSYAPHSDLGFMIYPGANATTQKYTYLALGNNVAVGTNGNKAGRLRLYGTTAQYSEIIAGTPTAARTLTLPDKSGTLALEDAATTAAAGLMSATDKKKLDGIAEGANKYTHPTGDGNLHVPATGTTNNGKVLTAGSTAGSAAWAALPTASSTTAGIVKLGTSSTTAATGDHTHDTYSTKAFSNVKVNSTTISSSSTTDTLTLAAGSNVTLTSDTTAKKVTITATDTKQKITTATTTKAYITGVDATNYSTGTAYEGIADTGVYLTTTSGQLRATSFSINGVGTFRSGTDYIELVF